MFSWLNKKISSQPHSRVAPPLTAEEKKTKETLCLKVVVCGQRSSGSSGSGCLTHRFVANKFPRPGVDHSRTGVDYECKSYTKIENHLPNIFKLVPGYQHIKVQCWVRDTQDRGNAHISFYGKKANIIVWSVGVNQLEGSWLPIDSSLQCIKDLRAENKCSDSLDVLVVTQIDLRDVPYLQSSCASLEQFTDAAKKRGIDFIFETSAKNNIGITEAFEGPGGIIELAIRKLFPEPTTFTNINTLASQAVDTLTIQSQQSPTTMAQQRLLQEQLADTVAAVSVAQAETLSWLHEHHAATKFSVSAGAKQLHLQQQQQILRATPHLADYYSCLQWYLYQTFVACSVISSGKVAAVDEPMWLENALNKTASAAKITGIPFAETLIVCISEITCFIPRLRRSHAIQRVAKLKAQAMSMSIESLFEHVARILTLNTEFQRTRFITETKKLSGVGKISQLMRKINHVKGQAEIYYTRMTQALRQTPMSQIAKDDAKTIIKTLMQNLVHEDGEDLILALVNIVLAQHRVTVLPTTAILTKMPVSNHRTGIAGTSLPLTVSPENITALHTRSAENSELIKKMQREIAKLREENKQLRTGASSDGIVRGQQQLMLNREALECKTTGQQPNQQQEIAEHDSRIKRIEAMLFSLIEEPRYEQTDPEHERYRRELLD